MEIFKMFATFGLTDSLSVPLAKMTSKLQDSGLEITGLSNQFISMSNKLLPVAETTDLLTNAFSSSATIVDKLQSSVAKISTVFNNATNGTEGFSNKILELAGSAREVALNLGAKLVSSITSSIPVTKLLGDVMSTVDKTLKFIKTGFSDMGSVVDTTKTILNKFGIDLTKVDIIQKGLAFTQGAGIDVVKKLSEAFSGTGPTAESMIGVVKSIGTSVLELVKTKIPIDGIASDVTSFISGIVKGGSDIGSTLKSVFTNVSSSASGFVGNIMQAVSSINIGDVMKKIGGSDLFESGKNILTSFVNGISSVASLPGKVLGSVFGSLSSTIKGPQEFLSNVVGGISSAINTLPAKIGGAISSVASFAGKTLNSAFNSISSVIKAPKELIGKAITGVSEIIKSPQEFMKSPFKSIKNIFMPDTNKALQATSIVPSIAKGIDESSPNLVSATDPILANNGVSTEIGVQRMSAQPNGKDSQNVVINIDNLNLPSVENVASFIDELRSLKISLGV